MSLHLLLDNADPSTWKRWLPTGIFHGITTNPSLLKQANQPCNIDNLQKLSTEAARLGCSELHLQAWGESAAELTQCGIALSEIKKDGMDIHIKIPISQAGTKAAKKLIETNISVTFTACFETKQIIIAEALGASYIAPYLKRINAQGRDGKKELLTMQKILNSLKSQCKLLVASITEINELTYLASEGLNTFTINTNLAKELFNVPATLEAVKKFQEDANSAS